MKKRVFQLGIYLPNIRVEGEYNLQGKVLILPLLGNGPAKIHLSEYNAQQTGSRIQLTITNTCQFFHLLSLLTNVHALYCLSRPRL